ncbi:MAG: bacteriocin [Crocosphaera sp.]|nr:bacteriocin [Crocosphaera sp.]
MKNNQIKINKHIQIKDLNKNRIEKFNNINDEELSKILGGFETGEGGTGCPMSGILGYKICGYWAF